MDWSFNNLAAIEKFRFFVEPNYKELVNGKFNDCTKNVLQKLEAELPEGRSDEDEETFRIKFK